MAQRLGSHGSLTTLSRPIGPLRAGVVARHRARRVAITRARLAAAKALRPGAAEVVDDLFSVVRTLKTGVPLEEENQERLDGLMKELLKSSARSPARSDLLPGSYQLLWSLQPTGAPYSIKSQFVTIEANGDYTNTSNFALAGLLSGSASQYGKYKAAGPNTYEVVFTKAVISKGPLGKEEKEYTREQGYRKFQIEHLGEDALVLKALAPQRDPLNQLVLKRVAKKAGQKADAGTTKVRQSPKQAKSAPAPLVPQMSKKAVAASEAARAQKSAIAAKIIAEKQAEKKAAIAAAEKLRAEKSKQAALLMAEKEAQKKAAKAKAEKEAKQAALEAERLKKANAAAAEREQQQKVKITAAVQAQKTIVSEAQEASRAALQAIQVAERNAQSVLREATSGEKKVAAAEAATAKAVADAEKAVSAQKEADALFRETQLKLRKLQQKARTLKL